MKTLHITIILAVFLIGLLFTVSYLKPVHADNANGIKIQKIQTLPTAIIVNRTFKINATLVNNSPNTIFVEHGACEAPFSVTFDSHVAVTENNITCTTQMILQKLDPGDKTTGTSPSLDLVYRAAEAGIVNATVTFQYGVWDPNTQSNNKETISEPFSFTIYSKPKVPTLTPSGNQTIIDTALAIPALQNWSHDWQFANMGFLGNNKLGTPDFKWQYAIVNLKAPSSSAPVPCSNDWWAWVEIDMTTMKVVTATYPTMDSHNCQVATGGGPASYGDTPTKIDSPLKQFKSGIAAKDVKCRDGLQFIQRNENAQPACVKPQTYEKLIERGWGIIPLAGLPTHHNNSIDKSSGIVSIGNQTTQGLTLFLSTDSKSLNSPEPLVVDISLNNTSSKSLTLTRSDNWLRSDLNLGPCSTLPFGISILKGFYTEQNMTGARSLVLYQNIPCPGPPLIKSYTFQPLSSKATQVCDTLFSCTGLVDMKTHLEINGFIDNNNQHQPFKVGTYTIIAGDEWGHVIIQHFTEAYAVAYDNSNLKGS